MPICNLVATTMLLTVILSLFITGFPGRSPSPCDELKIKENLITWGHEKINQPRTIEAIIVHSSYNALTRIPSA